jgi:hypothetical protein
MEKIDETLQCAVCIEYAREAVECDKCGNIFCENCVKGITCPLCRNSTQYRPSTFARKLINNIATICTNGCQAKVTIGTLGKHFDVCPNRLLECNQASCDFKGKQEDFIQHITSQHQHILAKYFDKKAKTEVTEKYPKLDIFSAKINSAGNSAYRGDTGRFFCGKKSDVRCNGCDGNCGPNNGCNCSACLRLDIEFYKLGMNQLLNHDGAMCEVINGTFYCGRKFGVFNNSVCAPTSNGGLCDACKRDKSLLLTYKKLLPDHFN